MYIYIYTLKYGYLTESSRALRKVRSTFLFLYAVTAMAAAVEWKRA